MVQCMPGCSFSDLLFEKSLLHPAQKLVVYYSHWLFEPHQGEKCNCGTHKFMVAPHLVHKCLFIPKCVCVLANIDLKTVILLSSLCVWLWSTTQINYSNNPKQVLLLVFHCNYVILSNFWQELWVADFLDIASYTILCVYFWPIVDVSHQW